MDNKILLQDLAQGVAKRKKVTRRDAESFIHKVFEVIEERVIAEGTVKVKGLGTFKINTVDSRESVNVATGERFVIDTHSRISFTPHPKLRDAVNRPFSDFETVVISDDVKTEDMEYIPPSDTPSEEPTEPSEEPSEPIVEPASVAEPAVEPEPVEEPSESAEEPSEPEEETVPKVQNDGNRGLASESESTSGESETSVSAVGTEPVEEPAPEPAPEPATAPTASPKPSHRTGIIIGVLAVAVLCILLFVLWHPNKLAKGDSANVAEQTDDVQEESTAEAPAAPVEKALTDEEAAEKYPQVEEGEYLIVGTKEEYTLQKGDDLFKLSVGMYGDKKFAPYIIVYNDIKNPSHIEIGDVLKLPELRKKK